MGKAEKKYQQFVNLGIGEKTIWPEVKGLSIMGEDKFLTGLIEHIRKYQEIPDIPKSQRYVNRPSLENIFSNEVLQNKKNRDNKKAVSYFIDIRQFLCEVGATPFHQPRQHSPSSVKQICQKFN
jgi:hypothetical protein